MPILLSQLIIHMNWVVQPQIKLMCDQYNYYHQQTVLLQSAACDPLFGQYYDLCVERVWLERDMFVCVGSQLLAPDINNRFRACGLADFLSIYSGRFRITNPNYADDKPSIHFLEPVSGVLNITLD